MNNIISRAPYDDFKYQLFTDILSYANFDDYSAYYMWTGASLNWLKNFKFQESKIILGTVDCFFNDENKIQQIEPYEMVTLLSKKYPNTEFIILHNNENFELEVTVPENIKLIPWGGCWTNQQNRYMSMQPIIDKNLNSTKIYTSFNRRAKIHRTILLTYLFSLGFEDRGILSYLTETSQVKSIPLLVDYIGLPFINKAKLELIEQLQFGYSKFSKNIDNLVLDDADIYSNQGNNNADNFINKLSNRYQDCFVEFVTETLYFSKTFNITEKTLHSIYACNFPIMIASPGIVEFMRSMGFDMFDDIVNHNYDQIDDPVMRIITAVDDNKRLLTDIDYVKHKWINSRDRFLKNVQVAKGMYTWYRNRALAEFQKNI
jgi:hypothetical protein